MIHGQRTLAIASLCAILSFSAGSKSVAADDRPASEKSLKQEKIKKIFDVTRASATLAGATEGLISQMVAGYKQRNPEIDSAQTRELIKILRSVNEENRDSFIGLVTDAWDNVYSDAEINAYYTYVTSPEGASFLAKSPTVKDQVTAAAKAYALTIMVPEITKAIQADEILKGIK